MENLTVAIVGGTGNLGGALALRLGAPGVKIIIGSRDAEKAKKAVETLRPNLRAGDLTGTTNRDAVKDANFVVIAVPYEGQAQMVQDLKGQLAGKIVIDTVVPLNKVKPFVPAAGSALQEAQQIIGDEAPVIGALHNISAVDLGDVDAPLGDVLVCGDNADAKQKVMDIIQRIGATAYDGGPSSNAYVIEGLTGVIIHLNRKYKSKHGSIKITGIGVTAHNYERGCRCVNAPRPKRNSQPIKLPIGELNRLGAEQHSSPLQSLCLLTWFGCMSSSGDGRGRPTGCCYASATAAERYLDRDILLEWCIRTCPSISA